MLHSVFKLFTAFGKKINEDRVSAYAAQTAFFIIVSFFPFLMFMLTLLQYLPFTQESLLDLIERFVPQQIYSFLASIIEELYSSSSGTVLSITIIVTLWTASNGIYSIIQGLNSVYHIKETRNYIILRIRAVIYTVIFAILLILLLGLFVFGNQISLWLSNHFPSINDYALLIISGRTIIGLLILVSFFTILYNFVPNRKSTVLKELPGAVISAAGWLGFSFLYSFYIDNMSNMASTYGSLTAIVLCMLWLYFCMSIMFFGAEVNSVLANPVICSAIKRFFSHKKKASKEE